MIPLAECEDRRLYIIHSRNLRLGVFDSKRSGFIGIREKLGSSYLFTEYHWETGAPFGTVRPIHALHKLEDDRIRLWERYPGSSCLYCGRAVEYKEELKGEYIAETGEWTSWPWVHVDGEFEDCTGRVSSTGGRTYTPLYNLLEDLEETLDFDQFSPEQFQVP